MADSKYEIWISGKSKRVPFWPTRSKDFVIVPMYALTLDWRWLRKPGYAITHVPSKLTVAKHVDTRRAARKIVAALMGLPIQWEALYSAALAKQTLTCLPNEIGKWLRVLANYEEWQGMTGRANP